MIRRSATHVVERATTWRGDFASEPWEAGWASEAIFFLRRLDGADDQELAARVQISPDGMRWVDEGGCLRLQPGETLAFVRVREFGGWLLAGQLPGDGQVRVILYSA